MSEPAVPTPPARGSCWLFHAWSRWSKPESKKISKFIMGRVVAPPEGQEFVVWRQQRECYKCSKVEVREVT